MKQELIDLIIYALYRYKKPFVIYEYGQCELAIHDST